MERELVHLAKLFANEMTNTEAPFFNSRNTSGFVTDVMGLE